MTRLAQLVALLALTGALGARIKQTVQSVTDAKITESIKKAGFCSYPMWNIPGVGTDTRCDRRQGCAKRTTDCEDLFGKSGGETCSVVCAGDPRGSEHGVEKWECKGAQWGGGTEWERVGKAINCPNTCFQDCMKSHGFAMRDTGMDTVKQECEENCACMDECMKAGGTTPDCNSKCQHANPNQNPNQNNTVETGAPADETGAPADGVPDALFGIGTNDTKANPADKGHHECYGVNWFTCKFKSGCRCDSNWNTVGEWLGCGAAGCQPA